MCVNMAILPYRGWSDGENNPSECKSRVVYTVPLPGQDRVSFIDQRQGFDHAFKRLEDKLWSVATLFEKIKDRCNEDESKQYEDRIKLLGTELTDLGNHQTRLTFKNNPTYVDQEILDSLGKRVTIFQKYLSDVDGSLLRKQYGLKPQEMLSLPKVNYPI